MFISFYVFSFKLYPKCFYINILKFGHSIQTSSNFSSKTELLVLDKFNTDNRNTLSREEPEKCVSSILIIVFAVLNFYFTCFCSFRCYQVNISVNRNDHSAY